MPLRYKADSQKVLIADFTEHKVFFSVDTCLAHIFNNTASEVWEFCKSPRTIGELATFLCETYDIGVAKAKKDVLKLMGGLKKLKLIEEVNS